jgi:hypothetical protein
MSELTERQAPCSGRAGSRSPEKLAKMVICASVGHK